MHIFKQSGVGGSSNRLRSLACEEESFDVYALTGRATGPLGRGFIPATV